MDRKLTLASAAALALLVSGAVRAADFALGFDGCPTSPVEDAPGTVKTFDVFATLTTSNNTGADGAQGWSVSIAVTNATVKAVTIKGVTVNTLFDEDEDPTTPLAEVPLDLGTADFKVAQKAVGVAPLDPTLNGVVSAIVLNNTIKRVLLPTGKEQILKITIDTTVPAEEAGVDVSLRFLNGMKGAGQPVNNVVTFGGSSNTPTTTDCTFKVMPKIIRPEFNLAALPDGKPIGGTLEGGFGVYQDSLPVGLQTVNCIVRLSSANLPEGGDGPQGWSLSLQNESCVTVPLATSVTIKGVIVETLFDEDEDPTTPLAEVPLDLATADFKVAQRASGVDPSPLPDDAQGVVSAIVLNNTIKRVLKPNNTDTILKVAYQMDVKDGVNPDCRLTFTDGLKGAGQPVNNVITYQGGSNAPKARQGLILRITGSSGPKLSQFIRGDANDDGKVNIADVVWTVYSVVPGLGGTSYPIDCKDAGDSNDDEIVNLVDAVYTLDWQFRGGPKPSNPGGPSQRDCGTDDDSNAEKCPEGSTACPLVP